MATASYAYEWCIVDEEVASETAGDGDRDLKVQGIKRKGSHLDCAQMENEDEGTEHVNKVMQDCDKHLTGGEKTAESDQTGFAQTGDATRSVNTEKGIQDPQCEACASKGEDENLDADSALEGESSSKCGAISYQAHLPKAESVEDTYVRVKSMEAKQQRELLCPVECVGRLIGKSGVTIRNLQLRTGVKIQIDQDAPEGTPRKVLLTGEHPLMDAAERMVREVIEYGPPETNRRNVYSFQNAVAYDHAKSMKKQSSQPQAYGMPNMAMMYPNYAVHPAYANMYNCYEYNAYMQSQHQAWTEHWTPKGTYFYNHQTGMSSWAG